MNVKLEDDGRLYNAYGVPVSEKTELNQRSTKMESGTSFNLLEFRTDGITERDAATLHGFTPERTILQLWEDKVNCEDPLLYDDNLFTARAKNLFTAEYFEKRPASLHTYFFVSKEIPFLRAEVYGTGFGGAAHETPTIIKVVHQSKADYDAFAQSSRREILIPQRGWVELQHEMIVTGAKKAVFVSTFDGAEISYVEVFRDPIFESNHVAMCIYFWDYVRRGVMPPEAEALMKSQAAVTEPGLPLFEEWKITYES